MYSIRVIVRGPAAPISGPQALHATREHDMIGGLEIGADLAQDSLHLGSCGEAVRSGWRACPDQKFCQVVG